jgi:hypothetical protein
VVAQADDDGAIITLFAAAAIVTRTAFFTRATILARTTALFVTPLLGAAHVLPWLFAAAPVAAGLARLSGGGLCGFSISGFHRPTLATGPALTACRGCGGDFFARGGAGIRGQGGVKGCLSGCQIDTLISGTGCNRAVLTRGSFTTGRTRCALALGGG